MKSDARAVENPISAIFDLSEKVAKQAPLIKSMVRYASAFIIVWLFISFFLLLALLVSGNIIMFLIMLALFVVGFVALVLLRRMNRFFRYYVARHRAIKAVRDMDPMVYAPQGKTPTERFVAFLRGHNPAISGRNVEVAMPGIVHGKQAMEYRFDAYIREPASGFWRIFGFGKHGFAIYIKEFDAAPTLKGMRSFKEAVEDVSARSKIPPNRIVALWERKEDQTLDDEVYRYVMKKPAGMKRIFRKYTCNLEIVSETEGRYDFIPHMVTGRKKKRRKKSS
jgi:ABC-type multidrug transport system fused ATPase/permease subunit